MIRIFLIINLFVLTVHAMEQQISFEQKEEKQAIAPNLTPIAMKKLIRKDDESKNIKNYFKDLDNKLAGYVLHNRFIIDYLAAHNKPTTPTIIELPVEKDHILTHYKLSPDGNRLAYLYNFRTIKVISLTTKKEIYQCDIDGSESKNSYCDWIGDNYLFIHDRKKHILWDLTAQKSLFSFDETLFPVSFSPDGKYFIDSTCTIWDIEKKEIKIKNIDYSSSGSINLEENHFFGNLSGTIICMHNTPYHDFFCTETGKHLGYIKIPLNSPVYITKNNQVIILEKFSRSDLSDLTESFCLQVYDLESGKRISTSTHKNIENMHVCPFDESIVLLIDHMNSGILWNVATQKKIADLKTISYPTWLNPIIFWNADLKSFITITAPVTRANDPQIVLYHLNPEISYVIKLEDQCTADIWKNNYKNSYDLLLPKDERSFLVAVANRIMIFDWSFQSTRQQLEDSCTLEQALLLLAIEKTYKRADMYEMDEASLAIFNEFHPEIRNALMPLISMPTPSVHEITAVMSRCSLM